MERFAADLATMTRTPLTPEHVAAMRRVGQIKTLEPGECLQHAGMPQTLFHYVLDGELEAIDPNTGKRAGTATAGPGQFFGELNFLTGGVTLMGSRAVQASTLLCVPREKMLQLMSDIPEMSDIIITVFAARRRRILEAREGGLTLLGGRGRSRYSSHRQLCGAQQDPVSRIDP